MAGVSSAQKSEPEAVRTEEVTPAVPVVGNLSGHSSSLAEEILM